MELFEVSTKDQGDPRAAQVQKTTKQSQAISPTTRNVVANHCQRCKCAVIIMITREPATRNGID